MKKELLEKRIEEVEEVTGSGTAMVSLYISAGSSISSERQRMSQEKSEAQNIKSDQNRKNVEKAISKVNDILKRYKQTPENGLVVFAGVTEDGSVEFVFDNLDEPLEYSDYTCDNRFRTEPLRERVAPEHSIGLLVVERGGSTIGELRGTRIVTYYDEDSNVMGKHNAGGQCLTKDTLVFSDRESAISTFNGTDEYISIENIEVGDNILAYESDDQAEGDGTITEAEVTNRWKRSKQKHTVFFEDENAKKITASGDHIVFLVDENKNMINKPVEELEQGHNMLRLVASEEDNLAATVSEVESVMVSDEDVDMIDIETTTGNFFADGYLVHNSAERFDRLIEEQRDNYFDSVRKKLEDQFVDSDNNPTVDGFVIGGTQITVDNFVSDGYLPKPLQDIRVGGSYSIDIANEGSLDELVGKARSEIDSVAEQEQRDVMDTFFKSLHEQSDTHATYGEDAVDKALDYGAVDTLLLSENIDRNIMKEYQDKVKNQGGELLIISDDFSEGNQFWEGFNGMGAILRYRLD